MKDTQTNASQKYLPVNDLIQSWGFIYTTSGFQNVSKMSRYPLLPHPLAYNFRKEKGRILNEYQLVYIVEGKGRFVSSSKKEVEVKAGTLLVLFPGEWHSYNPDPEVGWKEYWIGFKGDQMDKIVNSGYFSKENPVLNFGIHDSLIDSYMEVIRLAEKEKAGYKNLISGIILHMLGLIYYKNKNAEFADNPLVEKINKARSIMREHLSENLSPEDIANQIGIGYTWFRRCFKEYVGMSPGQYQLQLKHSRAKELLITPHLTVSDIAFQLGFESISQFSTFFKKQEGMSASLYRRTRLFS
ncbi:MAG: AraC family transcriptional regulator [Bacteroidales bacterium]|nr:AraC family transcriptional regulator [Bacteroidales bacterium]